MELKVSLATQTDPKAVLVVAVHTKKDKPELVHGSKALKALVDKIHREGAFSGGFKSTFYFPALPESLASEMKVSGLFLLGVGEVPKDESARNEILRKLGAVLAKSLNGLHIAKACLDLPSLAARQPEALAPALAEGAWLAQYAFNEYLTKKPKKLDFKELSLVLPKTGAATKKKIEESLERTEAIVEAVHFARDLGNLPGNDLNPPILAKKAEAMAKKLGVSATILDKQQIYKEGLMLLHAVGRGSGADPRLIVLEYNKSKKNLPHLCFVGKGLTFDSGGISIKPANGMEDMKFDMCGSAAVLGATMAIATLKLPVRLTTLVASAENMSGDDAIRPGDIFKSHKGLTVEITNTDAEGRLVLADALSYAQKYYKPDVIIDAATLTGAVVIALGGSHTGIMGNNEKLMNKLKAASKETGEDVWELPLSPYYEDDMNSPYADMRNSGTARAAGSSKGGIFLQRFIDPGQAWLHLDIAGTAYNVGHFDYCQKNGASGVMVRTLTALAENWKS